MIVSDELESIKRGGGSGKFKIRSRNLLRRTEVIYEIFIARLVEIGTRKILNTTE
jgi:hypothetical protein